MLVLDDSTLDKPCARKIELVSQHWSGQHNRRSLGFNQFSLLWTEGDPVQPCDSRVYDRAGDGLTRNDHALAMLHENRASL